MEEDIELLEMDLADIVDYLGKQATFEYGQQVGTAIENLINRNKQLEEIEKAHQKENGELREKVKELENADLSIVYMTGFYDGENKWKDIRKQKRV